MVFCRKFTIRWSHLVVLWQGLWVALFFFYDFKLLSIINEDNYRTLWQNEILFSFNFIQLNHFLNFLIALRAVNGWHVFLEPFFLFAQMYVFIYYGSTAPSSADEVLFFYYFCCVTFRCVLARCYVRCAALLHLKLKFLACVGVLLFMLPVAIFGCFMSFVSSSAAMAIVL